MMLDRKSAPPYADLQDFQLPSPVVETLDNKVPLVYLDQLDQQVAKIELVFRAGKWHEPALGVSQFTAQLLEKGTASKSSFQIAEYFDRLGASVEINPGFDHTSASLYTLSKNLKEALPLFCEITQSPVFPDQELNLLKTISRQNLKINNEKTSYLAGKKIRQKIFGHSHPYGSALEEHNLDIISQNQLIEFFKLHYHLEEIYMVGSFDAESMDQIRESFSQYRKSIQADRTFANPERDYAPQYMEKAGSIQSSLRLGKKVVNRDHSDYPAVILLNHLLGGYFGSRLMKNIREEKGLTYGIHSAINPLKHEAYFVIGTDVNKENRTLAIGEIKKEIQNLVQQPVSLGELELGKNHLLGSLQLETANPFAVIEKIKVVRSNQLPADFYGKLFKSIQHLSPADLQRTAQSYFIPETLLEVSVG